MKKTMTLLLTLLFVTACLNKEPGKLEFLELDGYGNYPLMVEDAPLNFATLKKYILEPRCISCHSGENAKPQNDPIDFTSYETMMVDRFVPLLLKGKPLKSRLFKSVQSGEMPVEGYLRPREIEFIRRWIKICAPKETLDTIPSQCKTDDGDDDDWDDDFNDQPEDDLKSDDF